MNDIFESPAFQEFLQKRCEEDPEYKRIDSEILSIEKRLYPTLDSEQLKLTLKVDSLNTELLNLIYSVLHRQFYDKSDNFTIFIRG